MNTYRAKKPVGLYASVNDRKAAVAQLDTDQEITGTPVPGFSGVIQTRLPLLAETDLFVEADDLVKLPPPVPEPLEAGDVDGFCALVTWAALQQGADRDALLAMAYALSKKLEDLGPGGDGEAGPFRFSAADWTAALTTQSVAKMGLGLMNEDRFRWERQPDVAARLVADGAARLATALGDGHPTRKELFFAFRFGAGAETVLAKQTAKCSDVIGDVLPGSYAAQLKEGGGTVAAALDVLRGSLDDGYRAAQPVIARQKPLVRDSYPAEQGVPAWLALARAEMTKGVAEIPGSVENAEIQAYHAAAGLQGKGDGTAWCGSFLTYCMLRCGDARAAQGVKTPASARAVWWKDFGEGAPDPLPVGAIIVLRSQDGGTSSGHVGFFEGLDGKKLRLLAGNQGNRVSIVAWDPAEVVACRVPTGWAGIATGLHPAPEQPSGLNLAPVPEAARPMAERIAAAFAADGYGVLHQAAAVANAWAESQFHPEGHNQRGEDSVGLFQFNRNGGKGVGHTVEELKDPDRNIALTIAILQRQIPQFRAATTLADAVGVFVRKFEVPKHPDDAIADRLAKARSILA